MADRSYTPREFVAVEDKINSSPKELGAFLEAPTKYLEKNGIEVSDEYGKELEESMREMQLGPRNFDDLVSMSQRAISISISIRIRF